MACWGVAGIATSLDHGDRHPSLFHPIQRECYQSAANAAPLLVWIDSHHIDFAHAVCCVELHSDKAHRRTIVKSNPYMGVFRSADILDGLLLARRPAGGIECLVYVSVHRLLNRSKNRGPCAKRKTHK